MGRLAARLSHPPPTPIPQAAACGCTPLQQEASARAPVEQLSLEAVAAERAAATADASSAGDFEWNEQYQALVARPQWTLGAAASKAVEAAAFCARFRAAAIEAAEAIALEQGLPPAMCSLPPLDVPGGLRGGEGRAYYYKGILLRVVQVGRG